MCCVPKREFQLTLLISLAKSKKQLGTEAKAFKRSMFGLEAGLLGYPREPELQRETLSEPKKANPNDYGNIKSDPT